MEAEIEKLRQEVLLKSQLRDDPHAQAETAGTNNIHGSRTLLKLNLRDTKAQPQAQSFRVVVRLRNVQNGWFARMARSRW